MAPASYPEPRLLSEFLNGHQPNAGHPAELALVERRDGVASRQGSRPDQEVMRANGPARPGQLRPEFGMPAGLGRAERNHRYHRDQGLDERSPPSPSAGVRCPVAAVEQFGGGDGGQPDGFVAE